MTTFTVGDHVKLDDGDIIATITGLKHDESGRLLKVRFTYTNDNGFNQTNWQRIDRFRKRVTHHTPAAGEPNTDPATPPTDPSPTPSPDDASAADFSAPPRMDTAYVLESWGLVDPTPSPDDDTPADLFRRPKQPGDLSDVITPRPAPRLERREMSSKERSRAINYLAGRAGIEHAVAKNLVMHFEHSIVDALNGDPDVLQRAPGVGHVTGPAAANAWNRAPAWVRECLPLGIEGYPPSYIEYVMVHDLAADLDEFRNKYPLPSDEQPFAHLSMLAGVTTERLAIDIYHLADFIEQQGNRGYSVAELDTLRAEHERVLPLHILHSVYADAYKGILFHATGDWGNYTGWGVKKNPHWRGVWMRRFQHIAPDMYQQQLDVLHAQALADLAVPPREHGDSLINVSTRTLAYHAACCSVLIERHDTINRQRARDRLKAALDGDTVNRNRADREFKAALYRDRLSLITDELVYRAQYIPSAGDDHYDPRLSLADAMDDYEQAAQYLKTNWTNNYDYATFAGHDRFFTPEYVEQVVCADAEPDLHIDLDDPSSYPRLPLSKKPPRQMTNREVLLVITQILTSEPGDEFAEDDKQLVLRYLRQQFPDDTLTDTERWHNLRARLDRLNLNRS